MNIIFLDNDGVLNDEEHFKKIREKHKKTGVLPTPDEFYINKEKIKILCDLVQETDSKIVFSSDLRDEQKIVDSLKSNLKEFGLEASFLGTTVKGSKLDAIKEYIDNQKEEHNYIILDDDIVALEWNRTLETKEEFDRKYDAMMCSGKIPGPRWSWPYILNTDTEYGLKKEHISQAKQILERQVIGKQMIRTLKNYKIKMQEDEGQEI